MISILTSFILALLAIAAWALFFRFENQVRVKGFISLILTLSTFFVIERLLALLPSSHLIPEIRKTPNLYTDRLDLGNLMIRKNGFRGRSVPGIEHDRTVRIFCMGGSSTYGIPIVDAHYSFPYILGKLLKQGRPNESFEVYNGGIPGYGLVQITDTLKSEVLRYKPDIVTISASFNDSSPQSTWYSEDGISDIEAYSRLKLLKTIQNLPIIRTIHNSKTFAYFRYYILKVQSKILSYYTKYFSPPKIKRVAYRRRLLPEEFEDSLRKIARMGEENNFVPVFVPEPVNRSESYISAIEKNRYYKAMLDVAAEFDLPVIDVLTPISERKDQWLFYDIVHPNEAGHKLIAETFFSYLFEDPPHPKLQTVYQRRGVDFKTHSVSMETTFLLTKSEMTRPLKLRISAPFLDSEREVLGNLFIENLAVVPIQRIRKEPTEFTFDLRSQIKEPLQPAYTIIVRAPNTEVVREGGFWIERLK